MQFCKNDSLGIGFTQMVNANDLKKFEETI